MTISEIRPHYGIPSLFLNDQPKTPIVAYVGPRFVDSFKEAGIELYTFTVPGRWWIGPETYDFTPIDEFLSDYVKRIPGRFFMPRIYLGQQGFPWWGERHPNEMNVVRDILTGEVQDQQEPNPAAVHYLGHEVHLETLNLHSFHSDVWRQEAGSAVAALVAHCEAAPYADQLWGWHIGDGLFQEWFHWSEYAFGGLADYSPAAQEDFRRWLRRTYEGDPEHLSQAWGQTVTFDEVTVPSPQARSRPTHGEFYDPVADRPTIDYTQCLSDAIVDSIVAISAAVKDALPHPKAVCVFYGYQFSDMPRPQLNGHYALPRLLASPVVDMIASPHAYSNRGEGGYHAPQAVADAIRRAGKLHFDEIDCKTVWTPASVTWKTHISQPKTVAATIEMMKKDAAYQMASGTAQWWMDLTDQGWFDAPEIVAPIQKLKGIAARLQTQEHHTFSDIAFVASQRSMMFQAPREGLHNATLLMFRNWHLSRMGAPFEQLLLEDLARPDTPDYKLYIMANLFQVSEEARELIERKAKGHGATVLWIYAPGYLNERAASLEAMEALTGVRLRMSETSSSLDVTITDFDHPITQGLPEGYAYGTSTHLDQYLRPPKIEYLPDMTFGPRFFADDPDAEVLGVLQGTGEPGLVVKDLGTHRVVYSAAPLLPWQLMRNIAQTAGAHVYSTVGDMVWANNAFLALYAQDAGSRTVRFPHPATVVDAYEDKELGKQITSLELEMAQWETKLLLLT